MKKYLGALLAGGMVFALVMGSAAALNITDVAPLQVGVTGDNALQCDEDGVDILVGFEDQGIEGGRRLSNSIIVSDIDADCAGAYLVAVATGADGELTRGVADKLGDPEYQWGGYGDWTKGEARIRWNTPVDPALITGVELHLNG